MKSYTYLLRNTFVLLCFIVLSFSTYSQTCGSTISTYPYSENFEVSVGAWTQDTGDNFDWTRNTGGTTSSNTGPSGGQGDSWYMYIETSSPRVSGDTANFESPCFDLTTAIAANFYFWYHMYGANIGSLHVELSTDNGSTYPNLLWSQTGQVQTSSAQAYNQVNLNLAAYVGQTVKIRFRGVRGASWDGDIAIDNVSMTATIGSFPEMDIQGNATSIADGDSTPSVTDDTDFGNVDVTMGTNPNTFTIQNTGTGALALTDPSPYVTISGAHAADFTLTANPSTPIAASGNTTFTITFNPSAIGLRTASVSIANDDSDENPYNFDIQGTGTSTAQEMNITGLGIDIADGDTTPSVSDDTDFGSVVTASGTSVSTFTIENLGTVNSLSLTGASPYVVISGAHAADFTITDTPSNSIAASSSTTFDITFDPSADGLRTASISIANNDSDENPYNFDIQGTGYTPPPCGNTVIHTADFETNWDGWTDGGVDAQRVNNASRSYSNSYSLEIRNLDAAGNNSSVLSPLFDFSSYDKVDFKFFFTSYNGENSDNFLVEYSNNSGASWTVLNDFICNDIANKNADYQIGNTITFYSKTSTMFNATHTFPAGAVSQIRVRADGTDTTDLIYIDNVTITGTQYCTPTTGPGGIASDLDLWLRADKVDGLTVGTDGANVSQWSDIGKGNHAQTVVSGQEPVYRNNATSNFNFNPVIEFENDHNTAVADMTYINTRDELMSTSGFNSNDIFMVVIPDPTITTSMYPLDTFTSSDPLSFTYAEDVTGFGFGGYTQRLTGEYFTYCIGTSSGSGPYVGYGRGDLTGLNNYNQVNIINVRHNSTNTDMEIYLNANAVTTTVNDLPSYAAVNNRKYFLGRSQYWNGSFDGRIAEVITYDSRKTDGTSERNRIESYLALKYGITLGTNGISMDYVDSSGSTVWDINTGVPVEDVFNYNIAGIFRDDASDHSQKQSKTYNTTDDITIGLGDIFTTNSANTNTFGSDRMYLTWGNDNGTLAAQAPVIVDMSAGIAGLTTNVQFTSIGRTWKVVENGGDIGDTKVSIPESMLSATLTPPGSYLMFISDSPTFSPTSDYRVMSLNGSDLETIYDFDGTKFITFGYAPEVAVERSVFFDGVQDYVDVGDFKDLNSAFTISAWIKRTSGATDVSIVSKRDASYTEGYDLKIGTASLVEMEWNGGSDVIQGTTAIPQDEWHHIAVIYSGGTANLYIDGVLDETETGLSNPTATTQSFLIAAAGRTGTTDFFEGNIDEVRVWDVALSLDQLRYIMNQEIEENATFADGMELPTSITKNEVATIPWSDLAGYYPMSVFTYTNTNDHSNNANQGALRNLDTVDFQTAPIPYESDADGNWDTASTWLNGNVQTIPGSASLVDANVTIDWNIVQTAHNITMSNATLPAGNNENRTILGLTAGASRELILSADSGLTVSHYLELNGSIDLDGESQLIQTNGSVLTVGANGDLERDQQGTADNYTYNYWSSPVGSVNTTATNATYASRYTVANVLSDGTTPASPASINFITSGYDGTNTNPIGIADFWIWKFADQPDDDYSAWQHVRSTGNVLAGEGYTMKGPGTGSISTDQNYVFNGKPNNGDIDLTISADNDYLIGNPYPSAIDALEFLGDNTDTDGTLYFWEHWGGGSHHLGAYQGGYALYNYAGGVGAPSYGTSDPDVNPGGTATKLPGQYIPVSQGFFVYSATGGTITFENDQRVFEKDDAIGDDSIFVRPDSSTDDEPTVDYNEDERMKLRIGFDSFNQLHRQLLLTIDQNATDGIDWGYDGKLNEEQIDDMYWMIEGGKYIIQGLNAVEAETVIPLGIHVRDNGLNAVTLDHLENVPDDVEIYVHDNLLDIYHDLRQSIYEVNLNTGEYFDRFEIVFTNPSTLGIEDELLGNINIFFDNESDNIVIQNPNLTEIDNVGLYNLIGQNIYNTNEIETGMYSEIKVPNLSIGTYILKLDTIQGKISKKILVK